MGTKNNPGEFDCYENADPDEPMFVLLARDPLAPILVRKWVELRQQASSEPVAQGRERDKLVEALNCATEMDMWRKEHGQDGS